MAAERNINLQVRVEGEMHRFSIQDELKIDRHDLDEEIKRQAGNYVWFAVMHEKARMERLTLEGDLEELEYTIDQEVRSKIADKKPTETAIKAMVRTDPRYKDEVRKLLKAEHDERVLGAIVSALEQRKDMLALLARSRYFEMSSGAPDEVTERIKRNLMGGR